LRIVILGWVGASLLFTAVLEISELGHKRLGFALYSNAVHFALWALTLPPPHYVQSAISAESPKTNAERRTPSNLGWSALTPCRSHTLGGGFPDLFSVSLLRSNFFCSGPIRGTAFSSH